MKLSRGFVCAVIGVAITILSWYGPWSWPAWPAYAVQTVFFGAHTSFADLPYAARGAFIVLLIAVNIGVWAGVARLLWWLSASAASRPS